MGWDDVVYLHVERIEINGYPYICIEDIFFELFFNGEMWRGMRWFTWILELFFNGQMWHGMLLKFTELFFNRERWCGMR
jgi:hypothetical protein